MEHEFVADKLIRDAGYLTGVRKNVQALGQLTPELAQSRRPLPE